MIRKLDWYLIKYFLGSLVVVTLILMGLFVVIDLFGKLKAFMEIQQASVILFIIKYYAYHFPIYLVQILPVITLAAAMLTISRFIKTNELTPMLSSGISTRRIIAPFFGVGFIVVIIMFLISETVIPFLETELSHTDKVLRFEGVGRYILTHDTDKNSILIKRYDYTHKKMDNIEVLKYNTDGRFQSLISADYGIWRESAADKDVVDPGWIFYNGVEYTYDNDVRTGKRLFGAEGYNPKISLLPIDLERTEKSLTYESLSDIIGSIRQYPHQPHLRMQLYNKFVFPLSLLILLLIGIPFLLIGESRNLFVGIGVCLLVTITFFVVQFFFGNLGNKGVVSPIPATVLPLFVFILIGMVLLRKMRT